MERRIHDSSASGSSGFFSLASGDTHRFSLASIAEAISGLFKPRNSAADLSASLEASERDRGKKSNEWFVPEMIVSQLMNNQSTAETPRRGDRGVVDADNEDRYQSFTFLNGPNVNSPSEDIHSGLGGAVYSLPMSPSTSSQTPICAAVQDEDDRYVAMPTAATVISNTNADMSFAMLKEEVSLKDGGGDSAEEVEERYQTMSPPFSSPAVVMDNDKGKQKSGVNAADENHENGHGQK